MLLNLLGIGVPVIGTVKGNTFIHAELAIMSDIVIAGEDTCLADKAHTAIGISSSDAVHVIWPELLGLNRGRHFLLTGADIDAWEALRQPFTLAGGMPAVTKNVRFILGAIILPLHDPVEIAEQIALVDIMSNARLSVIFGAGYVPSEFRMFGKSLKDRARLMDEGIEIVLRALNGERFEHNGRPIYVRPLPVQKPEDIIMVGGGVAASARRAERFGVGLGPMKADIIPIYEEECRKLGREPGKYFVPHHGMPNAIHLCEDTDEGWAAIERHAVHVITEYAK